ncbi:MULTISPECIES: histidine ammonia-lyase [Deinococcus]|jgi:histidine ammonia-lyase|uniref:Histidine ammonia-lyase n=1 Tax=Deinococcus enclensis TaxID=1049582 RepID=A0ABT9M996_9DEIO|nr:MULTISPECIES: histidine ammonia-lyase [Deinococcus]MDP9763157.1 histidine ammonia-lyase [Deinococcus enclensis]GHF68239.1 histidine ammonia-lyase [Deinococcus ficus]
MILDQHLTLEQFIAVVRGGEAVTLADAARTRIGRARAVIERIVEGDTPVYGVNTGFGKFANVQVPRADLEQLQHNLIMSHAIGVGEPLPAEVVRGMLLLRAQSLALGHSGVRVEVVELLLTLLNAGAHPVVPAQGSVGASGDLAPLAHLALALIGMGEVEHGGRVQPAADVLAALGAAPLQLQAKEGLALINGTQLMGSLLALALHDARTLLGTANLAAAMTVEAMYGSHRPFQPDVVGLRPHPGAVAVAAELRQFLRDSEIAPSHAVGDGKVQDAYSLRAAPQVHGASADALTHAARVLDTEFASVTDNPLIFPDTGDVVSGGNFHGQPLAVTIDALKVAVAELGSISERRCEQLLNPSLSGLPGFLTPQGGLNSGFMIAQYTAAALVSENKVLAHPASVDTIPTSANQEDHVSMGAHGARQLRAVLENVQNVLGIELMCAAQALDFQQLRAGRGVQAAWEYLRRHIPNMTQDRYYRPDLIRIVEMVKSGELLRVAQDA